MGTESDLYLLKFKIFAKNYTRLTLVYKSWDMLQFLQLNLAYTRNLLWRMSFFFPSNDVFYLNEGNHKVCNFYLFIRDIRFYSNDLIWLWEMRIIFACSKISRCFSKNLLNNKKSLNKEYYHFYFHAIQAPIIE